MKRNSKAAATIGHALQRSGHDDERVALVGLALRLVQSLAITLRVLEAQRVERLEIRRELVAGLGIEKHLEALARADPQMVAALRADVEIAIELGAIELGGASGALDPEALGHRMLALLGADPGRHQFIEPTHTRASCRETPRIIAESSGCRITARPRSAATRTAPGTAPRRAPTPRAAPSRRLRGDRGARGSRAASAGASSPLPIATNVPTRLRTMCSRNAFAVNSNVTSVPSPRGRRAIATAVRRRIGDFAWQPAPRNDEKSCSPSHAAAAAVIAPQSSACRSHQARRRRAPSERPAEGSCSGSGGSRPSGARRSRPEPRAPSESRRRAASSS